MSGLMYKGFREDEMEHQCNPRVSVPEYPELAKKRAAQAKKVRETAKSWLNVPYGSSPREQLDINAADPSTRAPGAGSGRGHRAGSGAGSGVPN